MQLYEEQEVWVRNNVVYSEHALRYSTSDAELVDAFFRGDIKKGVRKVPNPKLRGVAETFLKIQTRSGFSTKIECIKIIRSLTGASLKDAKEFVEECGFK